MNFEIDMLAMYFHHLILISIKHIQMQAYKYKHIQEIENS